MVISFYFNYLFYLFIEVTPTPNMGLELTPLSSIKSRMLYQLSQPGTLAILFFMLFRIVQIVP